MDSLERLAKYYEHVSKDLAAAKRCCDSLPVSAVQKHRRDRILKSMIALNGLHACYPALVAEKGRGPR